MIKSCFLIVIWICLYLGTICQGKITLTYKCTHYLLQKQACLAIRNLIARARENCDMILALGAEELVNRALTVPECKDEAKGALRDLGCKVALLERWKGEKEEIKRDSWQH